MLGCAIGLRCPYAVIACESCGFPLSLGFSEPSVSAVVKILPDLSRSLCGPSA